MFQPYCWTYNNKHKYDQKSQVGIISFGSPLISLAHLSFALLMFTSKKAKKYGAHCIIQYSSTVY